MKKMIRKSCIAVCATAFLACSAFAATSLYLAKADGEPTHSEYYVETETFALKDGASIRLNNPTGIRFATTVAENYAEGKTFGTIIVPKRLNDDDEVTIADVTGDNEGNGLNIELKNVFADEGSAKVYTAVVGNTPMDNVAALNLQFQAASYAKEGDSYTYTQTVTRSIAGVASRVYRANQTDETSLALLQTALTGCAVTIDDATMKTDGSATLAINGLPKSSDIVGSWSIDNESVATIDAKTGKVTAVAAGTATVTVKVGNATDTATITVENYALTGTVSGADDTYEVQVFNADGAYIETYTNCAESDAFSVPVSAQGTYKVIVTNGTKAAFIDSVTTGTSATGTLEDAKYLLASGTYAERKDAATDGKFVATTTTATTNESDYAKLKLADTFGIGETLQINYAKSSGGNADSVRVAGFTLYGKDGAYVQVYFYNGNNDFYNVITLCDGTTTYKYDEQTRKAGNNTITGSRIADFGMSSMYANYRVVVTDDSLKVQYMMTNADHIPANFGNENEWIDFFTLSSTTLDHGTRDESKFMAVTKGETEVNYETLWDALSDGMNFETRLMAACKDYKWNVTLALTENEVNNYALTGTVAEANDTYEVQVFDADGAYIETYTDCVESGAFSVPVSAQGTYKVIVTNGTKAAFIDSVTTGTSATGTLADAKYLLASGTYAERKDAAADGKFVATQTSGGSNPSEYVKLKLADTIGANETLQIDYVRKSGTAGVVRVAGFTLYGANGAYVHVYFSSNSNILDNFIVLCDGENTKTYKERDRGGSADSAARGYRIADFGSTGMYAHWRVIRDGDTLKVQYMMETREHVASGMNANEWIDFFTLSSTELTHRESDHWQTESGSVDFGTLWSAISGGMTFETELMANAANYTWDVTLAKSETAQA